MSFLQQLQQKKQKLHATSTVVTTITGERYRELSGSDGKVPLGERSYGFVVDTKPDTTAACIIAGLLYLGSQDAVTVENLNCHRITHLLSVGIEAPPTIDDDATMWQALHGKTFLPCLDLPETQLFGVGGVAQPAIDFIEAARARNGRVLVHCNAGVSRSASVVLAYLLQQQRLNFNDAYALVKSKRSCVQPNAGFMRQLQQFAAPVEKSEGE